MGVCREGYAWSNVLDSKRPSEQDDRNTGRRMAEMENQVPKSDSTQEEQPYLAVDALGPIVPGCVNPIVPPKPEEPAGGSEEPKPQRTEYEVVAPKREEPESSFLSEHYKSVTIDTGTGEKAHAYLSEASVERINKAGIFAKFASNQTRVYAMGGVALGLVVGIGAAALLLRANGSASVDMGESNAVEYGLKGHLTTEWKNNRLAYQLTVEPLGSAQHAGFATDVNNSPRPLSITVQARDPFGAVLCSDTILLKFDPHNALEIAAPNPAPRSGKAAEESAARNEIAKGIDLARLESQELDREHGKTLFQNDAGPDGQVASISAQGVLPCQKKDIDRFASWGFVSDFPAVAKPANQASTEDANAATTETEAVTEKSTAPASAAARARKKTVPQTVPPIYVEGDDQIVFVDAAGNVVETTGGKALILEKGDNLVAALKGRDLPVGIHYRCNEAAGCTFSAAGLGIHHARLRR